MVAYQVSLKAKLNQIFLLNWVPERRGAARLSLLVVGRRVVARVVVELRGDGVGQLRLGFKLKHYFENYVKKRNQVNTIVDISFGHMTHDLKYLLSDAKIVKIISITL